MFAPVYDSIDVIFFPGRMKEGYGTDFLKRGLVLYKILFVYTVKYINVSVVVMLLRGEVCVPGLTLQHHLDMTWGKHLTSGWSTEAA